MQPTDPLDDTDAADARTQARRRIAARYPRRRLGGPVAWVLLGILGAALITWTLWAGIRQSTPPVSARVSAFHAESDWRTTVTLDIQRTDTSRPAQCTLTVAGTNAIPVGEIDVTVPAGGQQMSTTTTPVRTTSRGLSANVTACHVP